MTRPAFQFYPGDWRKDVQLRSCSVAARGLWIDLMCVMHSCEPYGHLALNGKPMTPANISGQTGVPAAQVRKLLDELIENGVARINAEGLVYSKRMVNDERIRNARAEGGKAGAEHGSKGAEHGSKGGRPKADKGGSETPLQLTLEPPPSSSSSSSSSSSQPSVVVGGAAPSAAPSPAPEPAPPFDGNNAETLNGKAVVTLATNWDLPEQWGLDAEALGWQPRDVLREAEKFRQYWTAGRGTGTRRSVKGWRQTWSNWLEKAARDRR